MTQKKFTEVLRHDYPNTVVILLGTLVSFLSYVHLVWIYPLIVLLGMVWMGYFICPHCTAFSEDTCPSIYGIVAGLFTKPKQEAAFELMYKKHLPVVMLEWFFPLIAGIIGLFLEFDLLLFFMIVGFVLVAFVWLPSRSKKACLLCDNEDCPRRLKVMFRKATIIDNSQPLP